MGLPSVAGEQCACPYTDQPDVFDVGATCGRPLGKILFGMLCLGKTVSLAETRENGRKIFAKTSGFGKKESKYKKENKYKIEIEGEIEGKKERKCAFAAGGGIRPPKKDGKFGGGKKWKKMIDFLVKT